MKYIEHVIETNRLVLCWQATESKNRSRFVVGELVRDDDGVVDLVYLTDSPDYRSAIECGFAGHPAFRLSAERHHNVMDTFARRLPTKKRHDYGRYLELRAISPDASISDFTLLGYTGAKLPDDGFEICHPFDNVEGGFEFLIEVAGFRHEAEIDADELPLGGFVEFEREPDNPYDSTAIRISYEGRKLGYVGRGDLGKIHSAWEEGRTLFGDIYRKNGTSSRPLIYVYVSVSDIIESELESA